MPRHYFRRQTGWGLAGVQRFDLLRIDIQTDHAATSAPKLERERQTHVTHSHDGNIGDQIGRPRLAEEIICEAMLDGCQARLPSRERRVALRF